MSSTLTQLQYKHTFLEGKLFNLKCFKQKCYSNTTSTLIFKDYNLNKNKKKQRYNNAQRRSQNELTKTQIVQPLLSSRKKHNQYTKNQILEKRK